MSRQFVYTVLATVVLTFGVPLIAKGGGHGHGHGHAAVDRSTGEHQVRGYTTSHGTFVASHYQTNANGTRNDNYSTRGNINPHTGEAGTKPRDGEASPN